MTLPREQQSARISSFNFRRLLMGWGLGVGTLLGVIKGAWGVSVAVLSSLRNGEGMLFVASSLFQARLLAGFRLPGVGAARRLLHRRAPLPLPEILRRCGRSAPLRGTKHALQLIRVVFIPGAGVVSWAALSCHIIAEGTRWQLTPLYIATGAAGLNKM